MTMAPVTTKAASSHALRHRILTSLTRLSDRDTHAIAAADLESIIPTLTTTTLPLFISSLSSSTSVSDKSSVRSTSLRLLSRLAASTHLNLSPHLPKLVSAVVRRLRDSDSAVRAACVDAVASFAGNVPGSFTIILRTLGEALVTEQDAAAQGSAAMCVAAVIEVADEEEVDLAMVRRMMMGKWMKLLKCEGFRAKSAVVGLIGSAVRAFGVWDAAMVDVLTEFLRSEDWMARKAAAEALTEVARVGEVEMLVELKGKCLKVFEARRFDKVKAARESMNRMMEAWKMIPDATDGESPVAESKISFTDNASDGRYPPGSRISSTVDSDTPLLRKKPLPVRRPSPSDSALKSTARNRVAPEISERKLSPHISRKLDRRKPSLRKVEAGAQQAAVAIARGDKQSRDEDEVSDNLDKENDKWNWGAPKRGGLFSRNTEIVGATCTERGHESTVVPRNGNEEACCRNHKECEGLSLIRKHLVQIENQQASLVDLLQKFMASSQDGMRALETRVHGLERALNDISYDLAISNARMPRTEPTRSSCCLLPSPEFLRSKLLKRPNDRCSTTMLSFSSTSPPGSARGSIVAGTVTPKLENERFQLRRADQFIVNPLAGTGADRLRLAGC
ncbi:TORTIFOLIA1-like protein [Drosera capensis]